jgi:hypothetical protein
MAITQGTGTMRQGALQVANTAFKKLKAQGNRFYVYNNMYYFRTEAGHGWLVDFNNRDEIISQLWFEGAIERLWVRCKRIITDELLRLAMPVALPVDTTGIDWNDCAEMAGTLQSQALNFVNACDERNTQPLKG